MVLTLIAVFFLILLAAGLVAFVVLGEAWLLQRIFDAELWQLALVVLGSLVVVAYLGSRFLSLATMMPSLFDELDDEPEDEEDQEPIGPPPWRRSPPPSKQSQSKRSRR